VSVEQDRGADPVPTTLSVPGEPGQPNSLPEAVRRIVDNSVDAAVVLDEDRRLVYHNTAYLVLSGRRPRELAKAVAEGRRCFDMFKMEICDQNCLAAKARSGRPVRVDEIQALRGDNEQVTLIVTATPLGGGLLLESYRDVTAEVRVQRSYKRLLDEERRAKELLEQRVLERTEELRQANAELKRAQAHLVQSEKLSSLGQLVAGIAHELNNPINFIFGNVDFLRRYVEQLISLVEACEARVHGADAKAEIALLKEEADYEFLKEDVDKLLKSVRSGAERTAAIVRDLRAFSRLGEAEVKEFDLVGGIQTTLNLLRPMLRDRINVHTDFGPLPQVMGNAGHLNQVFMNLITNAAQAIKAKGDIFIKVIADATHVRVEVRDTGPGIPEEVRSKIFDPFFTTKPVGEGTGLGLSISHGIVQKHGGQIEVDTRVGEGASFTVVLPLKPPPQRPA
jgi:signal transduction histidine kinase